MEASWILYAMAEDRTDALIYHLGLTQEENRQKAASSRVVNRFLQKIKETENFKFSSLNGKFKAINACLNWVIASKPDTIYEKEIYRRLNSLLRDDNFPDAIGYLNEKWRIKRNSLCHSLFNSKHGLNIEELKSLNTDAYKAIRVLDNGVKRIKRFGSMKNFI